MTKHEYQSLPRPLAESLGRLDLRVRGLAVLRGLGVFCAIAVAALATGLGIDWLIDVGVTARVVMLVGVLGTILITLAAVILRPLFRRTSAGELAALVDAAYPDLGERIESAVELSDARLPERHRGSPVMRSLLLDQTVRQTETVDFGAAADSSSALRWTAIGALSLLLLAAPFGLSRDGYGLLIRRFLVPWENLERATNLYFHVENGDRAVARGTDVAIVAEPRWRVAKTALPDHAWLHWRTGEGKADARRMEFDSESGTFVATIPHVLTSFDYDVSAGRVRTRTYHIDVVEAPSLERLFLEIEPPAYTGRPARRLDGPSGRIDVFEGSRLTFLAAFNQPVASAEFLWRSGESDEPTQAEEPQREVAQAFHLADDSHSGTLTMIADQSGEFSIEFRNLQGVRNLRRDPWELAIIIDEPPAIEWADGDRALEPTGASVEVRPGEKLPLPVVAEDDIGVAELELHAEIVQRKETLKPLIAESQSLGQRHIEHTFSWDLSSLDPQEGDLLSVRARAVDGRPVPGPQEAWTASRLVRITTEAESVEESLLAQQQQQLRDVLEAIQTHVQQDREDTESLRQAAREAGQQQQPLDQQEPISNLAEQQKQLAERLDQLAAVFDEHPLQRNLSEATRKVGHDPLETARRQFQQAATSQPQEQLEQLTNAADELDRADDQLDGLLKRFDELAALEQDLQRLQQLAEDAEQLSNEVADFEQDWQELGESNDLDEERRQSRSNELAEQHDQLESNQQALSGALDRLLEERPEVLQAATEQQLERLKQLQEQASSLADREQRLADALKKESASLPAEGDSQPANKSAEGDAPAPAAADEAASEDGPPPPSVATKPSNMPLSDSPPMSDDPPMPEEPPMAEASAAPAQSAHAAEESEDQVPKPTALPSDEVVQDASEPPPVGSSIAARQQQLAGEAARMALETARSRGVENPASQQAKTFAEQALQAAEDAQTGLLDAAAEKAKEAAESARETAKQMHDPTDPAPESLKQQADALAQQQSALAEELREQAGSPVARQQAQAEGQKQLSEQTVALSEALEEIAERLGTEPLDQKGKSEQARTAQQAAEEAGSSMQSAREALQEGEVDKASPHAQSAAESLRKAAQQAGQNQSPPPGQGPGNNPSDQPSPVPREVGEQVAEARRQLQQAGQQLAKNGPSRQPTESPANDPGEQPSSQQADAQPTDAKPSDVPPESESKPGDMPPSGDAPPMEEAQTPSNQPGEQPQEAPTDAPPQNASESMKRVAESLRQAARQLGMSPNGPNKDGKPGEQQGDPQEGNPGSQSGNHGENPISLVELEAELKKMSSRDWGQLPGQIESELFQSTQKKPDEDYARLIRMYFEEISRRRSAEENLVPSDDDQ